MGIYQKPSPWLWVCYRDVHGKWVRKRTDFRPEQRAEADKWAADLEREVAKAVAKAEKTGKPPGPLTVADYAETWFKSRTNLTAKDDEKRIRLHVLPVIGELEIAAVKKAD